MTNDKHKLTSACFSCPARFGGTELFNLLLEVLVCDDTAESTHTQQHKINL